MSSNPDRFCVCLHSDPTDAQDIERLARHKAALLRASKWDVGSVITIRFLEGDAGLRARVQAVAEEWTRLANLTFDFVDSGPADIRIAFMQGRGSWSYLGRQCRDIQEPLPTMNYGWLTPESAETEVRRVVLHEFGHALGLIHEHQNPKGGIQWNRDAVIRDLQGPPSNWTLEQVEVNMFKHYPLGDLVATDVDPDSIMMYPIPAAWTLSGFSTGFNTEMSDTDKQFIAENYPR